MIRQWIVACALGVTVLVALVVWRLSDHVPEQDIAWGSLSRLDWQVPFGAGPVGISLNAKARLSPAAKALIGYLEQATAEQS